MYLRGQHGERGYAMAALLVALAVMAVMMSAALPAWRHQAKREKEAELVFRGEQYVRAISLWERKMGPGSRPPNFDILVEQRFLRKKYKDPMTEDGQFLPVFAGTNMPGATPTPSGRGGPGGPARIGGRGEPAVIGGPGEPARIGGRGGSPTQGAAQVEGGGPPAAMRAPGRPGAQVAGGGIFGVMSKSKEASIRLYQGRAHYNEWRFVHTGAANAPGGVGGSALPGGGGRATRPGQQGPRGGAPPGRGPGRGGGRGPGSGPGSGPGTSIGPAPSGPAPEPGPGPGGPPPGGRGGRGPGGG